MTRFQQVLRGFDLIIHATGHWAVVWLALLVIGGLMPTATVYLSKLLVDALASVLGLGIKADSIFQILWPAGLLGLVLLLEQIHLSAVSWIRTVLSERIQDYTKDLIFRQAVSVDLSVYESPAYHDHLRQANSEAGSRSLSLLENVGGVVQSSITLAGISILLLQYGGWIPLAMIVSTVPALYVVIRHNRNQHEWWQATTVEQRKLSYIDGLLTHPMAAPEVRVFDIGRDFALQYQAIRKKLFRDRLRLLKSETLARLAAGAFGLISTALVMGWLMLRTLAGNASLGDLALFYQAFAQGQMLMRTFLNSAGQIYTNTLYLEHLFTFLALRPQLHDAKEPVPVPGPMEEGITFENVTFRYPGSHSAALDNFNLFLPAGRIVAIVGANGAGKSTVTKLLCRFYDPQAGRVLIDGIDIRNFRKRDLLDQITIMFQLPVRYQASAADNISVSNRAIPPDRDAIEQAARGALIHNTIVNLPNAYDTELGKVLSEGAELSGGQWQRITMARAFYRKAPIVVLDEPTSAMDSWAESEWLDRFGELVEGKTALIITHRFTTAMRADVIYVMHEGRVIEVGTHRDLMATGGPYAASWLKQTRATVDGRSSGYVDGATETELESDRASTNYT